MKTRLLFIIIPLLLQSCVPTIHLFERDGKLMGVLPLMNGKVVYREKIDTPELPKEEVFRRARRWWVNNYRSARDVFQLVDKETGEIIGKGYGTVYVTGEKGRQIAYGGPIDVYHVISVDVSEDYYIVTIYGLKLEAAFLSVQKSAIKSMKTEQSIERYNIGTIKSVTRTFEEVNEQSMLTLQSIKSYIKNPQI